MKRLSKPSSLADVYSLHMQGQLNERTIVSLYGYQSAFYFFNKPIPLGMKMGQFMQKILEKKLSESLKR